MTSLPIVSLKGLYSADAGERKAAADKLGHACREVGFFYLTDHGIPDAVFEQLFGDSAQFFALPLADKEKLSIKQSSNNRGYVAISDEKLNPENGADFKEAFNIGVDLPADHPDVIAGKPFCGINYWPDLPGWRERMLNYFQLCLDVGRVVHRGFALDLGVDEEFFAGPLDNAIPTLRMLHYPPGGPDQTRVDAGAGEHTDYGNITLLKTDGVDGLQVRNRQGQWIDAPAVPGAFVCNIGDCLMRWSNDIYQSTPHRVRAPEAERYSVAFFLEVDPQTSVDPKELFPDETPKYPPIAFADYLAQRLDATYGHRDKD
ncbi:isopenicillin N synthase family dioxygenase [Marinobacterium litorale]|uniref:isopenicillin N synthase family dioxygenase n=1 Tax=Marinobacterium litorale TaxID=404770 RepID=UPI0004087470|nr:2-oxoglutarate and iron-dependent oxygenase domain-containing protein [Marinobacterium litorale]